MYFLRKCPGILDPYRAILILGYFNYLLLKDDNLGFESLNNRIKDYY